MTERDPSMDMPQPAAPLTGSAAPPAPPGALSPDGVWRWDGLGWVPAISTTTPYRPLGGRPRIAAGALLLAAVSQVVFLGALAGRLDLLGRISSGSGNVSLSDAVQSDNVVRGAALIELGATVVCAIALLVWLHRVVANNTALGARALRFTPGAAVGWWFVPLANWVMPWRVLVESWRAADPARPFSTPDQRTMHPVPRLLSGWWLTLAFGSVVATVANVTGSGSGTSLDTLHSATVMFMVAAVSLTIAGVLGAVVVSRLSERQRAQHAALAQPAAPATA